MPNIISIQEEFYQGNNMMKFKEFITESLLLEILDSKFNVNHHKDEKDFINNMLGNKIHSAHTAVMSSDHTLEHKVKVLRLKNHRGEIEYHILHDEHMGKLPPEQRDTKTFLHALKIINDDSKFYLDRGNTIKLQAHNDDQHKVYKRLANHLIKQHPNKQVKYMGKEERLDGGGLAHTLIIESEGFNAINWVKTIQEYEKNERKVK